MRMSKDEMNQELLEFKNTFKNLENVNMLEGPIVIFLNSKFYVLYNQRYFIVKNSAIFSNVSDIFDAHIIPVEKALSDPELPQNLKQVVLFNLEKFI